MVKLTDNFEDPLYDILLKHVHEDVDNFMQQLEGEWSPSLISDYRDKYPELPVAPSKPAPEVVSILWQNELRSSSYEDAEDGGRKLVRNPIGFADMSIVYYEQHLTEEFGDNDHVSWCVTQAYQPSMLHLLCRPALSSMAKAVRDINILRNRISEEQHDRKKIGAEYYGLLTCNPEYEEIARSQNIRYVYYAPAGLQATTWQA